MSAELMKVIAGLECCIGDGENFECEICPYDDGTDQVYCIFNGLMRDALEILREVAEDGLY